MKPIIGMIAGFAIVTCSAIFSAGRLYFMGDYFRQAITKLCDLTFHSGLAFNKDPNSEKLPRFGENDINNYGADRSHNNNGEMFSYRNKSKENENQDKKYYRIDKGAAKDAGTCLAGIAIGTIIFIASAVKDVRSR